MTVPILTRLYRSLGRSYPYVFLTVEMQSAFVITAATLGLFSFYYNASFDDYMKILVVALALTGTAVIITLVRTFPLMRPIKEWLAGARDRESTQRAWSAAVCLPLNLIRRDLWVPIGVAIIPACIWAVIVLDLSWPAFFPLLAGSLVALGYSAVLHYLILEAGMRPVLLDVNSHDLAPRLSAEISAIPMRVRLMTALPLINLITGLVVAAFTSGGGGGAALGADVLVAVAVATTISLELTVLFSKSILRPIADLQRATEAVRQGRYDASMPVTTGDELGELAASFNQMVQGLAERERIREAFGTYLDSAVAEYILSEGFSEEGIELEVSILLCDVRDFTSFARSAEAKEVVARLNELFEVVVPIVNRHGGHVDKFVGDGLLAVFGAPEPYPDHAGRAVRAACEMARFVNDGGGGPLTIGVGVNTGRVIAGSIGGGGRLNFSVIGDAVNVVSRVEAATREVGEDVLITEATARQLGPGIEAVSCGEHALKGIAEPLALYAPRVGEPVGVRPGEEPLARRSDGGRGAQPGAARREAGGLAQL
ncbi:MAG TPA: adenylate/guanylate cyclase domain-containing protein, partial [Solirubrobacterales bacterium]|nr:adenylate/guanylate cyclase domain-containing protein [Solirubrobacterales bacterium]